jgi:putative methionine-R-sulfoxide reductase with GAF domain
MHNFLFSLRAKALVLIGLALAMFVGTMGFHATAERQMRLEFVRDHLLGTAKLIAAQQSDSIGYAQQILESLVNAQSGRKALLSIDCPRTLATRLQEAPRIANIFVALPDGNVICDAVPAAQQVNIADRPYFQRALASPDVIVGEAFDDVTRGKRSLPFVKAVRDASGHTLGVIAVSLDLNALATELANATYPKGARLGLIDAKGQVLARHPDPEGWVGKDASGTPFFKAVAAGSGEGTFEELGFDGATQLYGLAHFAQTSTGPISLWLELEKNAVTADVERDFAWTVLGVVGLLLITFIAIWAGTERLFLRPISRLAAAARRLHQGDLSARAGPEHARDELGQVAQSFDDMAWSLEAKEQQIVLANRAVKVLSKWNHALLTPRDETSLIAHMCRSIVEEGGYRSAWVGFAMSDKSKTVLPVAWWGLDARFVASLGVSWADCARGRGPAGTAIRRATVVIVNDYLTNPDTAPWREDALRRHCNAEISLPLKVENTVIGALTISAAETESFDEHESVLLTELASALSSAIAAVRSRAARTTLEASLRTGEIRREARDSEYLLS